MNQVFLADVINWVGVAVGVLGAIIIAPSGFSELARQLLAAARRILLRRPKNVTVSAGLASASALAAQGYAHVTMSTDLPDHELVHQLVLRVNELSKQAVNFQQESNRRHDEITREIRRIEAGGQRTEAEIRKLISEAERQNARFNARGLPLIALGIVMTGPTSILAECTPVGWIFVSLGVCSMIYGAWPGRGHLLHRPVGGTAKVG
jgi:hypothetical protein